MSEHSDTELVDVVAVERATGKIVHLEKEVQRKAAEMMIRILDEMWDTDEKYVVTAPCGRYARGDRYVKGDD